MDVLPLVVKMHKPDAGTSFLLLSTAIPTIQGIKEDF